LVLLLLCLESTQEARRGVKEEKVTRKKEFETILKEY
jgi:hypothetical protein